MEPSDILMKLLLGGLLGAVGQGLRVIVGLKKVFDASQREGRDFSEMFSANSLVISLLIGFVAGVVGIVSLTETDANESPELVTLIGIGYAGADFIEGFVKSKIPSGGSGAGGAPSAQEPDADPEPPPVG